MSSTPPSSEIWHDARWLAQAMDTNSGLVRFVEMPQQAYREASFLDDRILQRRVNSHVVPWPDVELSMPPRARVDAHWIFHIGHVGSTLVSRLLGELDGVLAVREPRLLRDLATASRDVRRRFIATSRALLSRTFESQQIAVVKATSFVSEIAAELVSDAKALFLYVSPQSYIGSILAGENSLKELAMLADARAERMSARVHGLIGWRHTSAHVAAAAWACEMTALEAAASELGDNQLSWCDFDVLLGDIPGELEPIVRFSEVAASGEVLAKLARSPLLSRYSKALEFEYSPELRRELISEAVQANGADIQQALAMLGRAAQESPLLARALARSQSEL